MGSNGEYEMKIKVNEKGEELAVFDGFQYTVGYHLFNIMLQKSLSIPPHPSDFPNLRRQMIYSESQVYSSSASSSASAAEGDSITTG